MYAYMSACVLIYSHICELYSISLEAALQPSMAHMHTTITAKATSAVTKTVVPPKKSTVQIVNKFGNKNTAKKSPQTAGQPLGEEAASAKSAAGKTATRAAKMAAKLAPDAD